MDLNSNETPKADALLFNNCLLLGLDLQEMKTKQQLEFQLNTFDIERKNNQKILAWILHFLLNKLTDGASDSILAPVFPIRASTDYLGFKKQVYSILQNLEKQGILPKNFILSTSILDFTSGDQLITFLRFLSEFTLRININKQFPMEKLETFDLTLQGKTQEIPNIYELNSKMSDITLESKLKKNTFNIAIKACMIGINIQRKRFQKYWCKFDKNTEVWNEVAQFFIEEQNFRRKEYEELNIIQKKIKQTIPENFLKELRSLDRIQLIDLSRAFFSEAKRVAEKALENNTIEKIDEFYQDSQDGNLLNKLNKENLGVKGGEIVRIEKIYEKWNTSLEKSKGKIPEEEEVSDLLERLKETAMKTKENKEKIGELKEKYLKIKKVLL